MKPNLVHHKLDNQGWGKARCHALVKGSTILYRGGKKSFVRQDKPLRLILRGCQGSEKTLVIMRLAREFVLSNKKGHLIIILANRYEKLKKQLHTVVQQNELLNGRVLIGSYTAISSYDCLTRFLDEDEDPSLANLSSNMHIVNMQDVGAVCI